MEKRFKESQIDSIVEDFFLPRVAPGRVFCFKGNLGAGKTSLTKSIVKGLGLDDPVISPTFAYFNVFQANGISERLSGIDKIVHFDLYRLSSFEEFEQLGFLEIVSDKRAFCIIEWPEVFLDGVERLGLDVDLVNFELFHDSEKPDERRLFFAHNG